MTRELALDVGADLEFGPLIDDCFHVVDREFVVLLDSPTDRQVQVHTMLL